MNKDGIGLEGLEHLSLKVQNVEFDINVPLVYNTSKT